MGLMSKLFGGKVNTEAPGQLANSNKGELAIGADKALAATDSSAINPHNVDFSSIRTAPVVPKPRYFTATEAGALQNLATQKREMTEHTKKAYKALKSVDTSDRVVHQLHRGYQGKVAQNEVARLKSNTQLAEQMHSSRPDYAQMHQRVEVADKTAVDAIAKIKESYGG